MYKVLMFDEMWRHWYAIILPPRCWTSWYDKVPVARGKLELVNTIFNFYLNLVRFHVKSAIKESSWELQQGNFNNLLISWYAFTGIVSSVFNEFLSTLSRTFVIRQWYLMITLIYTNNDSQWS